MRPEFDARDEERLKGLVTQYDSIQGPRVGDYVLMLDGTKRRFTYDWGDEIQTTSRSFNGDASFYFSGEYVSFSGSLDPSLPKADIEDTGEKALAWFWFFHHNQAQASNGVSFQIPVRVWKQVTPTTWHDGVRREIHVTELTPEAAIKHERIAYNIPEHVGIGRTPYTHLVTEAGISQWATHGEKEFEAQVIKRGLEHVTPWTEWSNGVRTCWLARRKQQC